MNRQPIHRRQFFARSTAVVGTLAASRTASAWSRVPGANDAIGVAVVGLRARGPQLVSAFSELPDVRVVALCDADTHFLDRAVSELSNRGGKAAVYVDYRRLLEDKNVDAVVIVTPDHWHALMSIWACQAGKDVYVEKPMTHNIWEGRKMIEAARKYKRMVQVGSQNRSDVGLTEAIPWLQAGNLGKILMARSFSGGHRESIGKVTGPQPIPATCDYNLFQGPAPLLPLMRQSLHYHWHWFWDTGTSESGNLGAHELDQLRWLLGKSGPPERIMSIGGRYGWDDNGETPNTHVIWLDYKPVPILYELRNLPGSEGNRGTEGYRGIRASMWIECEHGFFAGGRGGGWAYDSDGKKIKQFVGDGGVGHQANFIQAVRSRKVSDLRADVAEGHTSALLYHASNISYRIGYRRPVGVIRERIRGNKGMYEFFGRILAHLRDNQVNVEKEQMTEGLVVSLSPEKERFVGEFSDWANMFVRREYRQPFVIPDEL
jgi:predicted dehydrogenase